VTKVFSLSKLHEGMNIAAYFESFNLTNRTNFGSNFSGNLRSSQYQVSQGLATGTYGIVVAAPYQAQLGFRFNF